MNVVDASIAFQLRRSIAQAECAKPVRVERVPTYQLVQLYLIDVTPEQLAEALRTTSLAMGGQHGAHVIKRKPEPHDAA
jgi:hypothetical protein